MGQYLIEFSTETHKRAKLQAVEEGITLKQLIIKAVEEYLARAKKKGGK